MTQTKPKQKEKKNQKQLIYYIVFLFINSYQLLSDYQILEPFHIIIHALRLLRVFGMEVEGG
jgi:hypothetical protein